MSETDPRAQLAHAIAAYEGFFVRAPKGQPTRAQRNNNPGNLRRGPRQIGTDPGGYAQYRTAEDGWKDLYDQLERDAKRGKTLRSLMYGYAPPSENQTQQYLDFLAHRLRVNPDAPLTEIFTA